MSELRNPHDLFFRETFSRLEVARDFIAHYLPANVIAVLDLNTLELQKDSFVDADLRENFSDLLYRVQLGDGSEANVYLLLEHTSNRAAAEICLRPGAAPSFAGHCFSGGGVGR
jgi:predicted transposase/invertase (TIGR01784 family)